MENNNERLSDVMNSYRIRVQDDPDSTDEDEEIGRKPKVAKKTEKKTETSTPTQQLEKEASSSLEFVTRESKFTSLINDDNSVKSIYCIFFILFSFYFWTQVGQYVLNPDLRSRDAEAVASLFPGLLKALYVWVAMKVFVMIVVYALTGVSKTRSTLLSFLKLFVEMLLTPVTPLAMVFLGVKHLSAISLFVEQVRLQMKVWAFMSDVGKKFSHSKEDLELRSQDNFMPDSPKMPSFSSYLYFLFAPTLIFREEYPKSQSRSIFFGIFYRVFEIVLLLMAVFKLWPNEQFLIIGKQPITPAMIASFPFPCAAYGLFVQMTLIYGYLHCWHNIWAEILSFGDRQFYSDFWVEHDLGTCFRKWNLIVSNFNINYILVPLKERGFPPTLVAVFILVISAVMHEAVVMVGVGFFLPVVTLFCLAVIPYKIFQIVFSPLVNAVLKRFSSLNYLLIWAGTTIAWTGIFMFNFIEYYSRQNCAIDNAPWYDFAYPRTFSCVTLTGIPDGFVRSIVEYFFKVV